MIGLLVYYNRLTEEWTARDVSDAPGDLEWPSYDTHNASVARGSGIGSLFRSVEQATVGVGKHLPCCVREEGAVGGGASAQAGPSGHGEST